MSKNPIFYNDELNLITLIKIIWINKIKIIFITMISVIIGIGYNYQLPNTYINTIEIKSNKQDEFIKLSAINDLLNLTSFDNQNSKNSDFIMHEFIFNKFINELEDYVEYISVIKKIEEVKKKISKLEKKDQQKELFKYASLLQIEAKKDKKKKDEIIIIKLKWNNPKDSIIILENTLNLTLNNLNKSIFKFLEEKLTLTKKIILINDLKRIDFLNEQRIIAKKLNIDDNETENISIPNYSEKNINLNFNANTSYYLRGYLAIDEEIKLIKSRKYQNLKFIEQELNQEKNKNFKWVNYNLYTIKSEQVKKTKLILIMSIILGLSIGILYVIISNSFQAAIIPKKRKK